MLEQPESETCVHNIEMIPELRHRNVDKQSKLLVDIDVTPPRGAVHITLHFNVLHREMQAATLRMYILSVSDNFCCLLIAFADRLDVNSLTLISIPEIVL